MDLRTPRLHNMAIMPGTNWAVSPLGTCVAYVGWDQDGVQRFYLVNVETDDWYDWSATTEESSKQWPRWNGEMVWSPDGSHLAFTGTPGDIAVWDLATDHRKWYDTGGTPRNLKWSPDVRGLYFTATGSEGGRSQWVLDLATGEVRELAQSSGELAPTAYLWLPNGRELIVPSVSGSLLLDVTDGSIQDLTYPGSEDGWSISELFFGPISQ